MNEIECFTIREVADQLKVSVRHIHRCIATGRLGCIRDGKIVRITEEQLAEFVASLTVPVGPRPGPRRSPFAQPYQRRIQNTGHLTPL